ILRFFVKFPLRMLPWMCLRAQAAIACRALHISPFFAENSRAKTNKGDYLYESNRNRATN
ncbi:MAG: hypothetical protein IIY70_00840, partial [Oscillospiraceae bacterium]|nr:hypothetical protein [Oscillospiraceae bacterium]